MKPFKKHLAIAIDGGGVRGAMVTRALMQVEKATGINLSERAELFVGTSAGSIIATSLAVGNSATKMDGLYVDLCREIFKKNWRTWPLINLFVNYQYPNDGLKKTLIDLLGKQTLGEFSANNPNSNIVMTSFNLVESRTRFIKTNKEEYKDWPVYKAAMASSAAPTFLPAIDGQFIDGAIGSYNNPCYLAAYEIDQMLKWKHSDVTLISLGTGRSPSTIKKGDVDSFNTITWLTPILDSFGYSAQDQQVNLVDTYFPNLDFRRFQIDMNRPIAVDDLSAVSEILAYGDQLGQKILNDELDHAMNLTPSGKRKRKKTTPT